MAFTVDVSDDLCVLSGYCAQTAPHLFEIRDDSVAVVVTRNELETPEDEALARRAAVHCPMGAITVAGP